LMWRAVPLVFRSIAKLWVVSDRLTHADAIVVLGGGLGVRPAAAANLYSSGIARRVLVARADTDNGRHAKLNREVLIQHGVPSAAIVEFEYELLSTYGESRGVLEWAKANSIKTVIIPIELFSTRRVRWIFNRVLGPAGIRATVNAITPPWYSVDDWWRHRAGLTNFRNELIKFAYYRVRY
jgi:hypothetical protein